MEGEVEIGHVRERQVGVDIGSPAAVFVEVGHFKFIDPYDTVFGRGRTVAHADKHDSDIGKRRIAEHGDRVAFIRRVAARI